MDVDIPLTRAAELASLFSTHYERQANKNPNDTLLWKLSNNLLDVIESMMEGRRPGVRSLMSLRDGCTSESQMDRIIYATTAVLIRLIGQHTPNGKPSVNVTQRRLCVVCKRKVQQGVMHKFTSVDTKRKAWINGLRATPEGRKQLTQLVNGSNNPYLCATHFPPSCFVTIGSSVVLRSDAVPHYVDPTELAAASPPTTEPLPRPPSVVPVPQPPQNVRIKEEPLDEPNMFEETTTKTVIKDENEQNAFDGREQLVPPRNDVQTTDGQTSRKRRRVEQEVMTEVKEEITEGEDFPFFTEPTDPEHHVKMEPVEPIEQWDPSNEGPIKEEPLEPEEISNYSQAGHNYCAPSTSHDYAAKPDAFARKVNDYPRFAFAKTSAHASSIPKANRIGSPYGQGASSSSSKASLEAERMRRIGQALAEAVTDCPAKDSSTLIQISTMEEEVHKRIKEKCDYCPFYCFNPAFMQSHIRNMHAQAFMRLSSKCGTCEFRTMDLKIMDAHLNWFHCTACDETVAICEKILHSGNGPRVPKKKQLGKMCINHKCPFRTADCGAWEKHMNQRCPSCKQAVPSCMTLEEHWSHPIHGAECMRKRAAVLSRPRVAPSQHMGIRPRLVGNLDSIAIKRPTITSWSTQVTKTSILDR